MSDRQKPDWSWLGPGEFIVLWCLFWTPIIAILCIVISAINGYWVVAGLSLLILARHIHTFWKAWNGE